MKGALETLFFAVESDTTQIEKRDIIFINACYYSALNSFDKASISFRQHFKPYAENLEKRGFDVSDSCDSVQESAYDLALILVPKNMIEARYMIAQGIVALREGGTLVCVADNKAGGARLKKLFHGFGFEEPLMFSCNKARAVRVIKGKYINDEAIADALEGGMMQSVLYGRFYSQPGIFGWDKIDTGSRILAENLPDDLNGKVADFGCGYGYLSASILAKNEGVETLYCVDADKRALQACERNMQACVHNNCATEYLWLDLVNPASALKNLDYVVMNPPFHEGKTTVLDVGLSFIESAYECLRSGGKLWMVANKHLAYEAKLANYFENVRKHYEGQGFKIYECVK